MCVCVLVAQSCPTLCPGGQGPPRTLISGRSWEVVGVCASRQSPPHAEAGGQRSAQDWLAEALSIDPPDPSPESGDALGVGGLTGELSAGWGGCQPGAPCPPPCAHTAPCLGHLLPQEAQRVHRAGSLHLYLSGPPVCRRLGLNQVCAGGRGSLALSTYRPMIPGVQGGPIQGCPGSWLQSSGVLPSCACLTVTSPL